MGGGGEGGGEGGRRGGGMGGGGGGAARLYLNYKLIQYNKVRGSGPEKLTNTTVRT
jgi:hypothetical protein